MSLELNDNTLKTENICNPYATLLMDVSCSADEDNTLTMGPTSSLKEAVHEGALTGVGRGRDDSDLLEWEEQTDA